MERTDALVRDYIDRNPVWSLSAKCVVSRTTPTPIQTFQNVHGGKPVLIDLRKVEAAVPYIKGLGSSAETVLGTTINTLNGSYDVTVSLDVFSGVWRAFTENDRRR